MHTLSQSTIMIHGGAGIDYTTHTQRGTDIDRCSSKHNRSRSQLSPFAYRRARVHQYGELTSHPMCPIENIKPQSGVRKRRKKRGIRSRQLSQVIKSAHDFPYA